MPSLYLLSVFASLCLTANAGGADVFKRAAELKTRHQPTHHERSHFNYNKVIPLEKRASPYLTGATRKFLVDGTTIPEVDFDVGDSYAGLLPISTAANETRQLFFWFWPSSNPDAGDEVTIWLNGGPGCSSLSGMLTENGPFLWQAGTLAPTANPYSWTNLTNMLYIEQPVGVGYSQGVPNISNERQLATEFMGFYKNFVNAFKLQNRKVYVTGESYGGYYIPYIANAFLQAKDKVNFNLAGVAINDPILGDDTLQQAIPVVPYLDYWSNVFNLNETFTKEIHNASQACGYDAYLEKYLTFPPPQESFPVPTEYYNKPGCDTFDSVFAAAVEANPCFNIYHILDTCPFKYSVLGIVNTGDYDPPGAVNYFNRTDVKMAIHAPLDTNWLQCTTKDVFGNGGKKGQDRSLGPAQDNVLSNVIQGTNNTIIGVGDLDFLLPTNGTLLALQNVTWNGFRGFRSPPTETFYVPYHPEYNQGALASAGQVGQWVTERGLTFYHVVLSGHELPEYAPGAGYRILEKLLGRIPSLSTTGDFTTQNGTFTGKGSLY